VPQANGQDGADRASRPIDRYGFVDEPEGRRMRGRRICEALRVFGAIALDTASLLDIGCSSGLITDEIARQVGTAVGVDVDLDSVRYASRHGGDAHFVVAAGAALPFRDGTFDAVVCNHVYEHVPNAAALMRDVCRVLRPGGACYFAGGHTLQLIEPHHRVPLLSWLPRRAASAILRAIGKRSTYDEQFLPPWRLGRLFEGFSRAEFVSARMLREPERFGFPAAVRWRMLVTPMLAVGDGVAARLAPTWIYVLRK
jgi:2-polyprenyl-3-methyl-5-hydroxy-6-metoxy-1,4-benzoquinol methylase